MHLNISAIPFVLSFLVIVIQPALDMVWMARYDAVYNAKDAALEGGAKWISDVSAFFPTAFLSIFGTLLIVNAAAPGDLFPWFMLTAFIAILAALVMYILKVYKRSPEKQIRGIYSALQYCLICLLYTSDAADNLVGLRSGGWPVQ